MQDFISWKARVSINTTFKWKKPHVRTFREKIFNWGQQDQKAHWNAKNEDKLIFDKNWGTLKFYRN